MSHARPVVVVLDDDPAVAEVVSRLAVRDGFEAVTCVSGLDALAQVRALRPLLAIVDLCMPDVSGLDVVKSIRAIDPACQVVLMTGFATVDSAIKAIKLGAIDYLSKPVDFARLQHILASAREETETRRNVLHLEGELAKTVSFQGMIGRSAVMRDLFALVKKLAPHVRAALLTGETGAGKELVAAALHALGPRHGRPLVAINCSAVVETLVESELFGHVKGAFTGALTDKAGMFEAADGGTLFLDEVGELSTATQPKLLRVLETGIVQRVGSLTARRVDVRVIAATNRDLAAEVAAGRFRADLLYRLHLVEFAAPLRERREDIPLLVAAFIREFVGRMSKHIDGLNAGAERLLLSSRFPGNVRELRNVIERACMLADTDFITERELSLLSPASSQAAPQLPIDPQPRRLVDHDRDAILQALTQAHGNKRDAAALLGMSRRAFYRSLERVGLANRISRRVSSAAQPALQE